MNFQRVNHPFYEQSGMVGYMATHGQWQFLIIQDGGKWTTSYRLIDPKVTVSASSTIRGPFDEFSDATSAADDMLAELRKLS